MRLYKIDVENLPGLGDIFHTIMFPHIYRLILHGNVLYGKAQVNISGWSLIMCWMQLAHKETVHFRLNCWRLFQKNGKGSPIWKHALQVRSDISNSMNIIIYCNICKPVIICKKKSLLRGGKMQGWFWQVVKSVAQLHLLHTNHPQKTKNGTRKKSWFSTVMVMESPPFGRCWWLQLCRIYLPWWLHVSHLSIADPSWDRWTFSFSYWGALNVDGNIHMTFLPTFIILGERGSCLLTPRTNSKNTTNKIFERIPKQNFLKKTTRPSSMTTFQKARTKQPQTKHQNKFSPTHKKDVFPKIGVFPPNHPF